MSVKTKVSPAVVGAFVIGAFALGVIALLSFGSFSLFSKPQRFVVFFDESISGLDLGSPVKLSGVRVGRVVDLNVRFDPARKQSVVRVVCEFNRNVIKDSVDKELDVTKRDVLQNMIDDGLRAQIGVIGLATGLLYVELGFMDPKVYPNTHRAADEKYAVVPYVPSAFSEFQANFSDILTNVKKVDFAGLAEDLRGFVTDARGQLNKLELETLVAKWTAAADSISTLAASPETRGAIANLNAAAIELKSLVGKLDQQVEPTAAKLNEALEQTKTTLASFNAASQTLRKFLNAQHDLGTDSAEAFDKLSAAADAVQRLADYLERNPQALLAGRKQPE
ncbi:MAG: MCE family protein [Opitutaceae bacterium]|nr:MCE family protein [Opitutaceae bacterium]